MIRPPNMIQVPVFQHVKLAILFLSILLVHFACGIDIRSEIPEITAHQQYAKILKNQNIASAPKIGHSTTTSLHNTVDAGHPFKRLSFSYGGSSNPECQISAGNCSAWDWSNHTHSTDSFSEPSTKLYSNPINTNRQISHSIDSSNMTYIDHYSCSEDWLTWYSETLVFFNDPIPPGNVVIQASFQLTGTFVCDPDAPTLFNLILQSDAISLHPIAVNVSDYPYDCSCPICAQNFTYTTELFPYGIPTYIYGAQNRIYPLILNGSMCINEMEMTLFYQPIMPHATSLFPTAGPLSGGTLLRVNGENFNSNDAYFCNVNGNPLLANVKDAQTLECLTREPTAIGEGRGAVTIYSGTTSISVELPFYSYREPNITSISPTTAAIGEFVTIRGSFLTPPSDSGLTVRCKFGNLISQNLTVHNSGPSTYLVCQVPVGLTPGESMVVQVGFNRQNWSNSTIFTITSPGTPKKWTDMPYILYIILGGLGGLLALSIIIFAAARGCRGKRSSEGEPLLGRSSYGPKMPISINTLEEPIPAELEKIDLSKLKMGARIGKGSFGDVFLATYLGTEVAVKKLPTNKISDEFMREFAREAALMRTLRHPNVLQFLGAAMDQPDICIVTEYMSKGSLYHILHDPTVQISWEMVRKIALDAAKGMAYLHHRVPAIIHRDLKSHNLLVDENWKVKVCDFGLSRVQLDQQATMTACGTPCWTAPEVLRNARYTTKADVFSYGIVLWELVTREEPYAGMPAFQVIFAVGTKGARLPLPAVCPAPLVKLMVSCWQEDPNLRPSFSEIITYLERYSFV